jgi:hypothetical protein
MAAGAPENDEEYESVCAFWYDHGQSLDWLINGDPGGLICPAAARSARAAVAVTAHDPIFTAIQHHRDTHAAELAVIQTSCDLSRRLPEDKQRTSLSLLEEKIVTADDPRWIASEKAVMAATEKNQAAADTLIEIEPTTIAGVIALLSYAAEFVRAGEEWPTGYYEQPPLRMGQKIRPVLGHHAARECRQRACGDPERGRLMGHAGP